MNNFINKISSVTHSGTIERVDRVSIVESIAWRGTQADGRINPLQDSCIGAYGVSASVTFEKGPKSSIGSTTTLTINTLDDGNNAGSISIADMKAGNVTADLSQADNGTFTQEFFYVGSTTDVITIAA